MHDHGTPEVDSDLLTHLGYEPRDVQIDKRLTGSGWWFFVAIVVSIAISWGFIGLVDRTQQARPTDKQIDRVVMPPPNVPLLQSDATNKKDIAVLRAEEAKKLSKLGWNEKEPGYATIPVDAAMRIVAERGLPTRPNAKVSAGTR